MIRAGAPHGRQGKSRNGIVETIKTIVYALLIAGVFRTLFFQPFWIPSGSMKETLLIGDFLFVNKMAYGYSYASCPSLIMPRFGINIDAKDICGVSDGDNTRLFAGEPSAAMWSCSAIRFRGATTSSAGRPAGRHGSRSRTACCTSTASPSHRSLTACLKRLMEPQGPARPAAALCQRSGRARAATCVKGPRFIETLPNGRRHMRFLNIGQQAVGRHRRVYRCPKAIISSWATTATTPPTAACRSSRRWRRFRAVRKPDRPRGPDHVLVRRAGPCCSSGRGAATVLQGDRVKLSADFRRFRTGSGIVFARPELLVARGDACVDVVAQPR